MKKLLSILGITAILTAIFSFVAFHSSMTKVDFNEANGVLKFTTKMNAVDLGQALSMEPSNAKFENAAKSYVSSNVSVKINGTPLRLTYTGSQVNGEAVWVYYEGSGIKDISKMEVKNTILLKQFSNQMNLVNIAYRGAQKTITLNRSKDTGEVSF